VRILAVSPTIIELDRLRHEHRGKLRQPLSRAVLLHALVDSLLDGGNDSTDATSEEDLKRILKRNADVDRSSPPSNPFKL
jgi:hypothetical protein